MFLLLRVLHSLCFSSAVFLSSSMFLLPYVPSFVMFFLSVSLSVFPLLCVPPLRCSSSCVFFLLFVPPSLCVLRNWIPLPLSSPSLCCCFSVLLLLCFPPLFFFIFALLFLCVPPPLCFSSSSVFLFFLYVPAPFVRFGVSPPLCHSSLVFLLLCVPPPLSSSRFSFLFPVLGSALLPRCFWLCGSVWSLGSHMLVAVSLANFNLYPIECWFATLGNFDLYPIECWLERW